MNIIRKDAAEHMTYHAGKVPYMTFPALDRIEGIRHMQTTRLGGVSRGCLSSLNLKVRLDETEENVKENFRRVARTFESDPDDFVLSDQTHTANVMRVTSVHRGMGLVRPRNFHDTDALITNERGIVLSVFGADCVTMLFADPVRMAVGAAHSGWRGTAARIAANTIAMMESEFGSDPGDIVCAICPSICRNCYEVGADVADVFSEFRDFSDRILFPSDRDKEHRYLDLWETNRQILLSCGVKPYNIHVTDICTAENASILFSHRASGGMRGVQGSFIKIL